METTDNKPRLISEMTLAWGQILGVTLGSFLLLVPVGIALVSVWPSQIVLFGGLTPLIVGTLLLLNLVNRAPVFTHEKPVFEAIGAFMTGFLITFMLSLIGIPLWFFWFLQGYSRTSTEINGANWLFPNRNSKSGRNGNGK